MGGYTGTAVRLKVKKDAPDSLIQLLDYIFAINASEELETAVTTTAKEASLESVIDNISIMVCGVSAYFDAWRWRVKEDCGEYWLYESRASTKRANHEAILSLVEGTKEFLFLEEGAILYRAIYEEGSVETIVCFKDGKFYKRDGYKYSFEGWIGEDGNHPYNFDFPDETACKLNSGEISSNQRFGEDFIPPWNVVELDALVETEKIEREKCIARRGGFR